MLLILKLNLLEFLLFILIKLVLLLICLQQSPELLALIILFLLLFFPRILTIIREKWALCLFLPLSLLLFLLFLNINHSLFLSFNSENVTFLFDSRHLTQRCHLRLSFEEFVFQNLSCSQPLLRVQLQEIIDEIQQLFINAENIKTINIIM